METIKMDAPSVDENKLHVVLFISRNKDNKHLENFKQRSKSFLTKKSFDSEYLKKEFRNFVNKGIRGETSRMYFSVNERDEDTIRLALIHFLIDNPEFDICAINSKLASIGEINSNAKTKKWLFDFDIDDLEKVEEFCEDIKSIDNDVVVEKYTTPNGYAVITNRGFDTRTLMEKWANDVELKRDGLRCVDCKTL